MCLYDNAHAVVMHQKRGSNKKKQPAIIRNNFSILIISFCLRHQLLFGGDLHVDLHSTKV